MRYIYHTQNGHQYPLELKQSMVASNNIVHDYERVTGYCRTRCKNYNSGSGCPPQAPHFSQIADQFPYGYFICALFYSKWKPEKVQKSKTPYIHYSFQDMILSRFLTNLGYALKEQVKTGVFFLSHGHCKGCGNKKCSLKNGNNICQNPLQRTFSLESTGVDVEATVARLFGLQLQWYKKNNYDEVEYMAKSIGLFTVTQAKQTQIKRSFNDCLQSLPSSK